MDSNFILESIYYSNFLKIFRIDDLQLNAVLVIYRIQ